MSWRSDDGPAPRKRPTVHSCQHCGKVYTARCNLSRHIRDQHSVADPNTIVCPLCGKNCKNRSNALTHLYRTHHITAKQLSSDTGALFNATPNNSNNNASGVPQLSQAEIEALVQGAQETTDPPPTFSFDDAYTDGTFI